MIYSIMVHQHGSGMYYMCWTKNAMLAKEFISQVETKRSVVGKGDLIAQSYDDNAAVICPDYAELRVYKSTNDPDCSIIATREMYGDFCRTAGRRVFNAEAVKYSHFWAWTARFGKGKALLKCIESVWELIGERIGVHNIVNDDDPSSGPFIDYVKLSTCVEYMEHALFNIKYFEFHGMPLSNYIYGTMGQSWHESEVKME